ncbi:hypothetical protein [Nonomuraea sp. NPDC048826]|uniref:hypothetical protein n=1 Tax=Nonomuraea sp. NPDC048826 TaxID=3364347 RepID=UPI00371DF910
MFLADIAGWESEQLAATTLSWRLELDADGRPRSYTLAWRFPVDGTVLTSTWTTGYRDWRKGAIPPPQ